MASQGSQPQPDGTPVRALVGLGANIGKPREQLEAAFASLAALPRTQLLARSSFYRTAPVGKADQPDFLNAAALITTSLKPQALLGHLLEIEHMQGRERGERNGPRTLDLDLLTYGGLRIAEPGLDIPHPRMHQRRFVLEPVVEIAPDCLIPGQGRAAELLRGLADQPVEKIQP